MSPIALPDTARTSRELLEQFRRIRATTVDLCRPLCAEDYVVQSMPEASPVKWHLAHTSWFFEEFVLQRECVDFDFYDRRFRYLFNSYYETVGPMHRRAERGLLSRPTVAEVCAYRSSVDERIETLLARSACTSGGARVLTLGLHHEQQHQELILTDLKNLFGCNPLHVAYDSGAPRSPPPSSVPALRFEERAGGIAELGHGGAGFCFDNELPRHRVFLRPFGLANRPVTNGEFLQFVRDGGYRDPRHWLSDGWATVQREAWQAPLYWSPSLESVFTLGGERALEALEPVCHVSYYEADAFARWAGARLPSEAEWEVAAADQPLEGNFLESGALHPMPAAGGPGGLLQIFGDVWEWTQSAYAPYPGYRPPEGALGEYNGKFMVNQLVLRGGSCVTSRSHLRASYRNFFYPQARWQFTGMRLARDAA